MRKARHEGTGARRHEGVRGSSFFPACLRAFVPLCLLFLGASCGYQQAGTVAKDSEGRTVRASLYRRDVDSVAIPIFQNRDFQRGIEFNLTKAIVNQVEAATPYKVSPKELADTILEGEVIRVDLGPISNDPTLAIPQEQLVTVIVNFTWKDLRTGKILVERDNFEQSASYYPTLGEGRFVGSQEAVEKMAVAIVQELQADW